MKFNISETFLDQKEDMSENDYFDKILDDMDDESNNKIIPEIPDNVFKAMTEFASSPKYLKIVSNEENGVDKIFIEATEFMNFCEARNDNVLEAAEAIIEEYQDKMPLLKRSDINIVFPSDSINKNILGGENLGEDIKNDWAMQLFTGCRRYGLRPRITGVTEAVESSASRQKDIKTTEGVFNSFLKKYNNHHDYDNIYVHMSQSSNYDKFINSKTNTMIFDVMVNLSDKQKQSMSKIEIAKVTRSYTSKAIDLFKGHKDELFNLISKKLSKYNVKDLKIGKIDIKVILETSVSESTINTVNEFSFFDKNKNDPKICRQVAIDTCKIATQFVKKKDRVAGDAVTADVANISFLRGKSSTCSIAFVHDLTRMNDPEYKKIAIPSISKAADICNKYKKELKNEIQNKLKKYTVTDINGTNNGFDITFDPDSLKKN